jgi:hypothetical protein
MDTLLSLSIIIFSKHSSIRFDLQEKALTLSSGLFSHTVPLIKYIYNISPHK